MYSYQKILQNGQKVEVDGTVHRCKIQVWSMVYGNRLVPDSREEKKDRGNSGLTKPEKCVV